MADLTFPRTRDYKDFSLSMGRNPVTNDVIAVTGDESVKRAIKNIINTVTGEVPFHPNYGSRVRHLLFEPIDPITSALLESEILTTIETFEPRAVATSVIITPAEDEQRYEVDITFRLNNLATPVTLSLFLTRLR